MSPRSPEPCPHFGRCGGCLEWPADHAAALRARAAQLEHAFRAVLGRDTPPIGWLHPLRERPPKHFRCRLLYPLRPDRRARLIGGLFARGSHELVEIERCAVQHPLLTQAAARLLEILRGAGVAPYDERSGQGFARTLALRWAPSTGEALIELATKGGRWDEGRAVARRCLALPPFTRGRRRLQLEGFVRSLHDAPGNRHLGRRAVPLLGRDHILDRVEAAGCRLTFRISAGAFYQTHLRADRLLFEPLLARLTPRGRYIVDAYAGVGAFGLRAAAAGARRVVLVEENPAAVRDAEHNVRRNRLARRCRVTAGAFTPETTAGLPPAPDWLVLDPPRSGLGPPGTAAALDLRPQRILYVSCHPPSLLRDLPALLAGGYDLRALEAADLFPSSGRLELAATLVRGSR